MPGMVIGSPLSFVGEAWIGALDTDLVGALLSSNSSQSQSATVGTAVAAPPSVIVTDGGVPVEGVAVTFTVTAGAGTLNPASPAVVLTNASGIATLTSWTLGTVVGTNTVVASASVPNGSPVTFTASGTVGAATQLTYSAQPPLTADSGFAFTEEPQLLLRDVYDNPLIGSVVTATITGAPGGVALIGDTTIETDASGLATFADLGLNGTAGDYTLTFTAGALSSAASNPITLFTDVSAWEVVGSASQPADNGTRSNTSDITITPPSGMLVGDLVWAVIHRGTNATLTNSVTGGQSWTAQTASNRSPDNASRVFWCIFNGTWDASPRWHSTGATIPPFTGVMHVFRWSGASAVTLDVAQVASNDAAPGAPFDVTLAGLATIRNNALVLAFWGATQPGGSAAITWALQTGGWANPGAAQYRNTAGNDSSLATAYLVQAIAGATGSVTNRQSAGLETVRSIIAFAADAAPVAAPTIAGTALSYHAIEITLTRPGGTATTHHLYRGTTASFVPGPSNKIGDDLGLSFTVTDEPLAGQTTYYYRCGAVSPAGERFSAALAVTTGTQLALTLAFEGGAEFAHAEDDLAVEIQYQTTTYADTTFAAPVDDVLQTDVNRYRYAVDGLTGGAAYRTRARTRLGSTAAWEAWSGVVTWTASAATFESSGTGRFTSPPFATPLRGTAAELEWTADATVLAVHISADLGTTWSAMAGFTQTGIVFDTTAYADGPHIVRVTQDAECQYFYHGGVLIDNANAATYEDDFYTAPRPDMARYFSPLTPRYLPTASGFLGSTGHVGVANLSSFGPIEPAELTACRGVCFMGECVAAGTGAGFQWDRTQAGELLDVGLVVLGTGTYPGGEPIGVRVGIKHFFMSTALGPAYTPILDPSDPFRFVGVAEAVAGRTELEVGIGTVGVQPVAGWHKWSVPCTAGMSWTKMTLGGTSQYKDGHRLRPYQFILWVTRPDPTNFPARIRVRARLDGPDAWACTGRRQTLVDETVDVERPITGDLTEPYTFEPGSIGFFSDKVSGNRAEDSGRFLMRYSAVVLEEPLPPPEVVPEPDSALLAWTGKPCTVEFTVYDDDRITPLWQVGTDPNHENPYLMEPDNYNEQEIDAAMGSASIGTVSCIIVDRAQIAGDQDSGWMTERVARFGFADVVGHRGRMVRFISAELGYQVIADGPISSLTMDSSFAGFKLATRDTRETERKLSAFEVVVRSLVPDAAIEGYGYDPATDTYIIDPALPLKGHWNFSGSAVGSGTLFVGASEFPEQLRRLVIWQAAYDAIFAGLPRINYLADPITLLPVFNPNVGGEFYLKWRAAGTTDAWKEIRETLHIGLSTVPSTVTQGCRVVGTVWVYDRRLNNVTMTSDYDPLAPALPTEDQIVEFFLIGPVAVDEQHPFALETTAATSGIGLLNTSAAPVLGRFAFVASIGGFTSGTVDLTAVPGNPVDLRRLRIETYNAISNESTVADIFIPSAGTLRWRAAGTDDAYQEISLNPAAPFGNGVSIVLETPFTDTYRIFTTLIVAAPDAVMPIDNQDIEIVLLKAQGTLSTGLTAGQCGINLYDGIYSRRDPLTGAVVPTGIRYDPAAMLLMTDAVRTLITERWEDLRDEMEKKLYAPTGWIPALDFDGRISPVSQISPADDTGLDVIHNGITEPSSEWDAGQRIINVLHFKYIRDYDNGKPDPNEGDWNMDVQYATGQIVHHAGSSWLSTNEPNLNHEPPNAAWWVETVERQSVVGDYEIILEATDTVSVGRHGRQVLELDGSLFRAIGKLPADVDEPNIITRPRDSERRRRQMGLPGPLTEDPIIRSGALVIPISGTFEDEVAYGLFVLRRLHVLDRYSLGAPCFRAAVMRTAIPLLRAGDWVAVDISWLPDYVTQRRGLIALGQVIAIADLDCGWRRVLIEMVVPVPVS